MNNEELEMLVKRTLGRPEIDLDDVRDELIVEQRKLIAALREDIRVLEQSIRGRHDDQR